MDMSTPRAAAFPVLRLASAAVPGAVSGAVIGPEMSAILGLHVGGLATVGAPLGAVAGVLIGVAARALLGQGTRHPGRAGHRASWATVSAACLLVGGGVLAAALWDAGRRQAVEMDGILVLVLLPPVAILVAALVTLAVGVLRRRATARWAAVVASVCVGAAACARLLGELSPLATPDPVEWRLSVLQAALLVAIPVAITALLLSPAARRDFRAGGGPAAPSSSG
ncbi:hypothetical protein MPTA5024_16900 [Microbispora sp. ATCC PTA-5024]|nr:hypothetical protein MPTA5024_16900 [Microbispora sp. ATCC PTA-5024]